jgi:hypothetical protein
MASDPKVPGEHLKDVSASRPRLQDMVKEGAPSLFKIRASTTISADSKPVVKEKAPRPLTSVEELSRFAISLAAFEKGKSDGGEDQQKRSTVQVSSLAAFGPQSTKKPAPSVALKSSPKNEGAVVQPFTNVLKSKPPAPEE